MAKKFHVESVALLQMFRVCLFPSPGVFVHVANGSKTAWLIYQPPQLGGRRKLQSPDLGHVCCCCFLVDVAKKSKNEKLRAVFKTLVVYSYMGVSKNRGTPKWMVYNGKPY